jgi:Zn finger protein HypA/HybF involved in hydrogenase expression
MMTRVILVCRLLIFVSRLDGVLGNQLAISTGTSNTKVFCTKCGSSQSTLAHKRELAIMKIPCLRDDIKKFDITPQ